MTKTIGNWGCLLTVYNMFSNYLELTDETPPQHLERMRAAGAMSGPYLLPAAMATAFPEQIKYDGYIGRGSTLNERVRQHINNGLPVPARVDFLPETEQWEQHWVLVNGYDDNGFICLDPWYGDEIRLKYRYDITGDDIIEGIFYSVKDVPPPPPPAGELYQVDFLRAEPQAWRVIRRTDGSGEDVWDLPTAEGFVRVKNGKQGEWYSADGLLRFRDTSPAKDSQGNERLYIQTTDGQDGGVIAPEAAEVGKVYEFYSDVQFYNKANCHPLEENSGNARSTFQLVNVIEYYTFPTTGLTVDKLFITEQTGETQLYAIHNGRNIGWVGGGASQNNNNWGGELAKLYFDRNIPQTEPNRYCA